MRNTSAAPMSAPATAPTIPAELADIVQSVHGLHTINEISYERAGPVETFAIDNDKGTNCATTPCRYFIWPGDFAAIYNLNPVYQQGIDGSGQSIAILGRSAVYQPDIANFQTRARLTLKDPVTIVPPGGVDPGPASGPGVRDRKSVV